MAEKINLTNNVWQQRELGVNLPHLDSINNIGVWCDRLYPFLQLVDCNAIFIREITPKFIIARTNWTIYDYGDAISVSAPHDGSYGGVTAQIETVAEVAALIFGKKWERVELFAGTAMMKRLLWIESKRCGFELIGYTPTVDDQRCYDSLKKQTEANGLPWQKAPKIQIQGGRIFVVS